MTHLKTIDSVVVEMNDPLAARRERASRGPNAMSKELMRRIQGLVGRQVLVVSQEPGTFRPKLRSWRERGWLTVLVRTWETASGGTAVALKGES